MIEVDAKDLKQYIGKYIVLYNSEKFVVKIDDINEEDGTICFTQVGGKDDGKKYRSRYDRNGTGVKVYDEEESVVALLE